MIEWNLRAVDAALVDGLRPGTLFDLTGKVGVITGAGGGLGAWGQTMYVEGGWLAGTPWSEP